MIMNLVIVSRILVLLVFSIIFVLLLELIEITHVLNLFSRE